jgi:integrase
MIRDPYHQQRRFDNWFSKVKETDRIDGLSKSNSKLLLMFIKDFRLGLNTYKTSKKGARSYKTLNELRQKVGFIMKILENRAIEDVRKATEKQVHQILDDMKNGKIPSRFGRGYKSAGDYMRRFRVFWHWYMKVMKKKGKLIPDIAEDLDTRGQKPKFVYFSEDDFERIINSASCDLKPCLALAFDAGVRVTELVNIRVSDFSNDYKEVHIREETSKTFGRRIKLMLCSKQIREYVSKTGLEKDDYVVNKSPPMINKELRKLGKAVLSSEQIKYKNLTLYDFRHSSACFWLPKYKSESALKYRFGWKKSDMIHYYTEFLGMKDTITSDDLYDGITKADLEKEVQDLKKKYYKLFNVIKSIDRSLVKNISKA